MLALAMAARSAEARELRLSHQMPESDARHKASRVLVAELKKRGRILRSASIPNSSLITDPVKQYDALIEGKIEMAVYPMGYASAKFPELSIVTHAGCARRMRKRRACSRARSSRTKLQAALRGEGLPHPDVVVARRRDGEPGAGVHGARQHKGLTARSGGGNDYHSMLAAAGAKHVAHAVRARSARPLESGKLDVVAELVRGARKLPLPRGREVRHRGRGLQHAD